MGSNNANCKRMINLEVFPLNTVDGSEILQHFGCKKTLKIMGMIYLSSGYCSRISGCHQTVVHCLDWCHMDVSENSGFPPQIIPFSNRVFHYFHHAFWGTTIFGKHPDDDGVWSPLFKIHGGY